jgi:cytochrome P450
MSGIFDTVGAARANKVLGEAVMELVTLKREQPGPDMPSWLMAHPAQLTDTEMLHQITTLLGGGTEPEQNLIVNALRLLLSDDRFAGDLSGGNLPVEDALDEVLWTDPPLANFSVTYPDHDLDFAGVRLPAHQPVVISHAAANTDPSMTSERRVGNRAHLAWSAGPHTCPAKGPARLIASVAIERLLDALPDMELAIPADQLQWRPGPFHRALTALPVRFPPVSVIAAVQPGAGGGRRKVDGSAPSASASASARPAVPSGPRPKNSVRSQARRGWSYLARWWKGGTD